ncbi:MAG: PAS domain S-box protein [Cyclobacteriaceae bacterium]
MTILYIEDNSSDFELLDLSLRKSKVKYKLLRAETKDQVKESLKTNLDLVLSDYNLNSFTGRDALKIVREYDPLLPFICISGTVGEEQAVELLHEGADDFLLKKNVKKLPIIIEKALANRKLQKEKVSFQKELIHKNNILDSILNSFEDIIFFKDGEGKYLRANASYCKFLGIKEDAILGKRDQDIFDENALDKTEETDKYVTQNKKSLTYEWVFPDEEGETKILEITKNPVIDGNDKVGIVGFCRDITEKKQMEMQSAKNQQILNQAEKLTSSASFEYDTEMDIMNCSPHMLKMMSIKSPNKQISSMRFLKLIYKDDIAIFKEEFEKVLETKTSCTIEHRFVPFGTDEIRYGRTSISADYNDTERDIFYGTIIDTTQDHELNRSLMSVQENERNTIASELHDNLGQKLSACTIFLDSLSEKYPEDQELIKVSKMTNDSLQEIRSMSSTLSLNSVKEFGLANSIKQLQTQIPLAVGFDLNISLIEERISEFISSQTFRIVQEGISNIQKHSKAKNIGVELRQDQSIIHLKIKDDGVGFDTISGRKGNGLRNIEQRVKKCNGLLHIDSVPDAGTLIDIKLPIS